MIRWREGKHWQVELGPVAAWFGIANDRWMVGIVFHPKSLMLVVGLGPFYCGIGAAYDR